MFAESEMKKHAIVDNPPIRCVGFVSGDSGRKNIDQSIEWNRKTFQKVVLSSFTALEHAGEHSVTLIPPEDPTRVGAIGLMGAFIDSIKVHKFEGPADTTITLRHKDDQLNNRLVDITCGVEQSKPPEVQVEVKMLCSGEISSPDGSSFLTANFTWDGKNPIRTTMKMAEAQTDSPVSIVLKTDDQGRPVLSAEAALDGHVEMFAEVRGALEMHSKYLAAWDRRKVDLQCLTADAMNDAVKRIIEKADRAVAADSAGVANPSAKDNSDAL